MGSRYTTVFTKIWQDEKFRALDADSRMLFLYLLTSPHSNMVGFYYLPIEYIAADMGKGFETVSEGLLGLSEGGLIEYDSAARVVLVINHLKYNPLQNPNQAKGAVAALDDMPRTPLVARFLGCVHAYCPDYAEGFETVRERLVKGFETVSEPFRNQITETETVTVTGTSKVPASRPGADAPEPVDNSRVPKRQRDPTDRYPPEFEEFWSVYPRKREKGGAYKAWKARMREKVPHEDLIIAARNYAAYCERKCISSDYIKYASTFLSKDRPFKDFGGVPPDEIQRVPRAYATLRQFMEEEAGNDQSRSSATPSLGGREQSADAGA